MHAMTVSVPSLDVLIDHLEPYYDIITCNYPGENNMLFCPIMSNVMIIGPYNLLMHVHRPTME